MKIEIEVTEEEIKSALERKARVAIADQTNSWPTDNYIKEKIKELWKPAVDALIEEILSDLPALRVKVLSETEKKLKAKINAVMKQTAQEV